MYEFCINVRFEDLGLDAIQYISHIIIHFNYILERRINLRPIIKIEIDPKENGDDMGRSKHDTTVHKKYVRLWFILYIEAH